MRDQFVTLVVGLTILVTIVALLAYGGECPAPGSFPASDPGPEPVPVTIEVAP